MIEKENVVKPPNTKNIQALNKRDGFFVWFCFKTVTYKMIPTIRSFEVEKSLCFMNEVHLKGKLSLENDTSFV